MPSFSLSSLKSSCRLYWPDTFIKLLLLGIATLVYMSPLPLSFPLGSPVTVLLFRMLPVFLTLPLFMLPALRTLLEVIDPFERTESDLTARPRAVPRASSLARFTCKREKVKPLELGLCKLCLQASVDLCWLVWFFGSTCLTLFPRLTLRCLWLEAAREALASVACEGLLFFFLQQRQLIEDNPGLGIISITWEVGQVLGPRSLM